MKRRGSESLGSTGIIRAPIALGKRVLSHAPLVPDRLKPQPERRISTKVLAAGALAATAVVAAGTMVARRIMDRAPAQDETMVDWGQSELSRTAEHSSDGIAPVVASASEAKPSSST